MVSSYQGIEYSSFARHVSRSIHTTDVFYDHIVIVTGTFTVDNDMTIDGEN